MIEEKKFFTMDISDRIYLVLTTIDQMYNLLTYIIDGVQYLPIDKNTFDELNEDYENGDLDVLDIDYLFESEEWQELKKFFANNNFDILLKINEEEKNAE